MMAGEVTREQFARFIDANPYWEKGNKQELVDDNKVNDTYLENWDSLQQNQPVTHISFYAAEAFCAWLTEQLPPGLDNYYVRLPTEAEWEYVARTLWKESVPLFEERNIHAPLSIEEITAEAPGIKQLRGNLWEWCENWYFPADYLVPDSLDAGSVTGVEKAVRGGSWANREEEITPVIRGSQPPSWCTPFLGFRAILVEKAE
jgi:formylglycine-generating enzyme required for sulfatase activity